MRIAIVTTSYPIHAEDPSGHFVRAEARALAYQHHDVHVITPFGARRSESMDPALRLWTVPHLGIFGWPGAAARLRARPWNVVGALPFCAYSSDAIRRVRPELVIAHWLVPSAFPVAAGGPRVPLEAVAHGADVRLLLALPDALRAWIVAHILTRARVVRFAARSSLDHLSHALPSHLCRALLDKAVVALPPIELPNVAEEAAALRRAMHDRKLVVLVARLVPSKRVELAVDAMQSMPDDVVLHVIGDGPARAILRARDRRGRVAFDGVMPRREALAWIAAAGVLLHVSAAEAAPTVVREARMLGTPVIACDAGDVARWARSDAGIRVVAPEVSALVAALRSGLS